MRFGISPSKRTASVHMLDPLSNTQQLHAVSPHIPALITNNSFKSYTVQQTTV